jgi:hypothetical protein
MKRKWTVVRDGEAEAEVANEDRIERALGVEAAIVEIAGTGNLSDPEKIVENETEMLGTERVVTEMIDIATTRETVVTSVVGIAETGVTDVGIQARTVHVLVLEKDEEQATVHAVAAERGENVIAVAIEYVQPALPQETLNSKNGN